MQELAALFGGFAGVRLLVAGWRQGERHVVRQVLLEVRADRVLGDLVRPLDWRLALLNVQELLLMGFHGVPGRHELGPAVLRGSPWRVWRDDELFHEAWLLDQIVDDVAVVVGGFSVGGTRFLEALLQLTVEGLVRIPAQLDHFFNVLLLNLTFLALRDLVHQGVVLELGRAHLVERLDARLQALKRVPIAALFHPVALDEVADT